jgi:hypothetical protein
MRIEAVRTAARSPWQNAYVERLIGSIRRECLDNVIVVNEIGLLRVLASYVAYTRSRTHLAQAKDRPVRRPVHSASTGRIVATPEVGGPAPPLRSRRVTVLVRDVWFLGGQLTSSRSTANGASRSIAVAPRCRPLCGQRALPRRCDKPSHFSR